MVIPHFLKFLPHLYIDNSKSRIWREPDSWYKKLKRTPIWIPDELIQLFAIFLLFPLGLPAVEALDRGDLFSGVYTACIALNIIISITNKITLYVLRSIKKVFIGNALLLVIELTKGTVILQYDRFFIYCWLWCVLFYFHATVNALWTALLNKGYDFFPELKDDNKEE